jgi:transcriptional regulator with XRE-family HTH domain
MSRQNDDESMRRNIARKLHSEERRQLCASFGRRLAAARRRRGLTQVELGEAVDIRTWMVSRYELGRSVPRLDVLVRLRSALAVSLDHLLAGAAELAEIEAGPPAYGRKANPLLRAEATPSERAIFCRDLAARREAEERHEEALALYDRAACLFEDLGEIEDQATAWIAEGDLHLRLGDNAKALECFDSAALLATEGLDPVLAIRAERGSAIAFERTLPLRSTGDKH